jgi:hypothetical protein
MGRVNSLKRMRMAAAFGCHSVDGSMFSMFRETHLDKGLRWVEQVSRSEHVYD